MDVDVESIVKTLRSAAPACEPYALLQLSAAQLPHLDDEAAVDLLKRLLKTSPPNAWPIDDKRLDSWSPALKEAAMTAVRALPAGDDRLYRLARVPNQLSDNERREVFDGIIDGTLGLGVPGRPGASRLSSILSFLSSTPTESRETWLSKQSKHGHWRRERLGLLTDTFVENQLQNGGSDALSTMAVLGESLPDKSKATVLQAVRSLCDDEERRSSLVWFTDSLSAEEHLELVEQVDPVASDPRVVVSHLNEVSRHLVHVSETTLQTWLDAVLEFDDDEDLQPALFALLPALDPTQVQQLEPFLVASALRTTGLVARPSAVERLSDDTIEKLVSVVVIDWIEPCFRRMAMHVAASRPNDVVERCLLSSLANTPDATRTIEVFWAFTPWLHFHLDGRFSNEVAALPLPEPRKRMNRFYSIDLGWRHATQQWGIEWPPSKSEAT